MKTFAIILSLLVSISMMCACGGHEHEHEHGNNLEFGHNHDTETSIAESHDADGDEIVMSPEDAANFGVKVDTVSIEPFNYVVDVTGEVTSASGNLATVSAPTAGIITFYPSINTGMNVRAGMNIAKINGTGVSGGNVDKAALVALNAAKAEFDRLMPLYSDGLVTRSEYNNAKAEYEKAKAAYSPVAASGVAISPISGVIAELLVQTGSYVTIGQPIATISNNSSLLLRADVPEKYRNLVQNIVSANIRSIANGEWINIEMATNQDAVAQNITPGFIPMYFRLKDIDGFASGSFVDVCLIGKDSTPVISVKNGAISEQQGEYFVYVKVDDHGYQKKNVKLGQTDGVRTVVLSGLEPGEIVVTEGTTMIRLAETSTVVPEGHSHHH